MTPGNRRWTVLLRTGTQEALETYGALQELYQQADGYIIDELLEREAQKLGVDASVFARPFSTLSSGERTKLMLAALFLRKNNYLLIDEPTNHLDREGREAVSAYLSGKEGFLLISHDRDFLDGLYRPRPLPQSGRRGNPAGEFFHLAGKPGKERSI